MTAPQGASQRHAADTSSARLDCDLTGDGTPNAQVVPMQDISLDHLAEERHCAALQLNPALVFKVVLGDPLHACLKSRPHCKTERAKAHSCQEI